MQQRGSARRGGPATRLDEAVQRWFLPLVLVSIGAGIAMGETVYHLKWLSPYLLGGTMALTMTRVRWEDFGVVLRRPGHAAGLLVVGYLGAGLSGLLLAAKVFPGKPLWFWSFAFLWLGPAATISSVWTQFAGGHVALAITLTAVSVAAASAWTSPAFAALQSQAGLFFPAGVTAGISATSSGSAPGLGTSMFWFVALPAAAGLLVGHRWRGPIARFRPVVGLVGKLAVLAILFINTAGVRQYLAGSLVDAACMAAITIVAQLVGYLGALAWAKWPGGADLTEAIALGYASATRNTALAITLSGLYLPGPAPLVPTVAFIVQEPLAALVARIAGSAVNRRAKPAAASS